MKRIKNVTSGAFNVAKRLWYFDGVNPVGGTMINPNAAETADVAVYSLEDVQVFLACVPKPAATAISIAAFCALRVGELEGLNSEDYRDDELHITRAVWNGHTNAPKTKDSANPVPVIKQCRERLGMHRLREMARLDRKELQAGPIFTNSKGTRMDMTNLAMHRIMPAVNRCAICGASQGKHLKRENEFVRDTRIPEWHGWRSVATNLRRLGLGDIEIQKILRHSDVATTTAYYIKPGDGDKRKTMAKLEAEVADKMSLTRLRDIAGTLTPDSGAAHQTVR